MEHNSYREIGNYPNQLDNFKRYNRVSPTGSNDSQIISRSKVTKTELPGG